MSCPHTTNSVCSLCSGITATVSGCGVNYTASTGSGNYGYYDPNYELFTKYAHLEDEEIVRLFLEEHLILERKVKADIEILHQQLQINLQVHEAQFYQWAEKYRKSLTKERLLKLKAFL